MLICIIYWLMSKKRRMMNNSPTVGERQIRFAKHPIILIIIFMIILLFSMATGKTQNLNLNYKIVKDGDEIGWLTLDKTSSGGSTKFLLVSAIKTRVIFNIAVTSRESSVFENGKLVFSSQYRKTNGTVKLDKMTRLNTDKYEVVEKNEAHQLPFHFIGTNLLSLYFNEPIDINFVYCDNHEDFIPLIRTEDGGYKLKFPKGNSNTFYYQNGYCSVIKIDNTLYSAEIILKP